MNRLPSQRKILYLEKKLEEIKKEQRELRIIGIIIFMINIIFTLISENHSTYVSLFLISLCLIWGMIVIYSLDISYFSRRKYMGLDFNFYSTIEKDAENNNYEYTFILEKEYEFEIRIETRKLYLLKMLYFVAVTFYISIVFLLRFPIYY